MKPHKNLDMRILVDRNGRLRDADAYDMYKLLGLSSDRLPAEGMPVRRIQGVRVYVRPLLCPVTASGWGGKHLRRNFQGLRVMAICDCGQHVAVGRLHQHICTMEPVEGELSIRIRAEQDARKVQGCPKDVVASASAEIIQADQDGHEWVGALGGLRYNHDTKEWS